MNSKRTTTPVMKQFWDAKKQHPDSIMLFRMGDFYETFDKDAKIASEILSITLTKRANGAASTVPLAGFPYHALEKHLYKLLNAGYRVAICEQVEDPKKSKGIVKREVVEVLSPGTAISEKYLQNNENNFLGSAVFHNDTIGLAFLDYSTGQFMCGEWLVNQAKNIINRYSINEIIICENQVELIEPIIKNQNILLTTVSEYLIDIDTAYDTLINHFNTKSLKGFGIEDMENGICAAGSAFSYIENNYMGRMEHVTSIKKIVDVDILGLDSFTIRNLEIFHSLSGLQRGTLIDVIDRTITPMGSRQLKSWIKRPLNSVKGIKARQKKVTEYYKKNEIRCKTVDILHEVSDIDRIIARLSTNKSNPRDLINLLISLRAIDRLKKITLNESKEILKLLKKSTNLSKLCKEIEKTVKNNAPSNFIKGGYINDGFSKELDNLRKISVNVNDWLVKMQISEQEKTGISSLKVGYNRVFGYYIEVTKTHLEKVPDYYIRKQTLTNAERFFTTELKEYEIKILSSEEKILVLEQQIFESLKNTILNNANSIQKNAKILSEIDIYSSLADVALSNDYSCPKIINKEIIELENCRHPVVEQLLPINEDFIPNSIKLGNKKQIAIITGPNMAGKSTYLRQIALCVILAQMGSYVPADSSIIGIVDKLFTRVGSSDNLVGGESTFLVEMNETANILNNATNRSLIILDEIGRGTSTYDGLSIAWAITEFIHNNDKLKSKTLFATHYHELVDLADKLSCAFNLNISVKESNNKIVFLRKIVEGGADKSYGVHVAEMAGLPNSIILRAHELLNKLMIDSLISCTNTKNQLKGNNNQIKIFDNGNNTIINKINDVDVDSITPLEALQLIAELKENNAS